MTTEWSLCFRSLPLLPPSFSLPLPLPCKASMGNWARHSRRLSRLCPHPPDVSLTPHPPPPKRRTTLPYKFFHDLQRVAVTIITINLIRVSLSPAITICHHSSDSTAPCFPPPPTPTLSSASSPSPRPSSAGGPEHMWEQPSAAPASIHLHLLLLGDASRKFFFLSLPASWYSCVCLQARPFPSLEFCSRGPSRVEGLVEVEFSLSGFRQCDAPRFSDC